MLPVWAIKWLASKAADKAKDSVGAKAKTAAMEADATSPMEEESDAESVTDERADGDGRNDRRPRRKDGIKPLRGAGVDGFLALTDDAMKFWYESLTGVMGFVPRKGSLAILPGGVVAATAEDAIYQRTDAGRTEEGPTDQAEEGNGLQVGGMLAIFALPLVLGVISKYGIKLVNKDGKETIETTRYQEAFQDFASGSDLYNIQETTEMDYATSTITGDNVLSRAGLGGYRISSGYKEARSFGSGTHKAIDVAAPVGTPIEAPFDGYINFVKNVDNSTAGKYVEIASEDGRHIFRFLHLSKPLVKAGDLVRKGQVIALSGNTYGGKRRPDGSPWSSGPHIHIEYRRSDKPIDVNKSAYGLPLENPLSYEVEEPSEVVVQSGIPDVRVQYNRPTKVGQQDNNLMSLRADGVSKWEGAVPGTPRGQMEKFTSPAYGLRAGMINLLKFQTRYDVADSGGEYVTIASIATNSKKHNYVDRASGDRPAQWALNVASASGYGVHEHIDLRNPEVLARVTQGISVAEHSARPEFEDVQCLIRHFEIINDVPSNSQPK